MARSMLSSVPRTAARLASNHASGSLRLGPAVSRRAITTLQRSAAVSSPYAGLVRQHIAPFSTTLSPYKGIMPDTENPSTESEETPVSKTVAPLCDQDYHQLADLYLETMQTRLEELQDKREDVDVEFSAGVLTVTFADKGSYVINKQPPNKQIWLSSPISGPSRFDWVVTGEGQYEKEGTASGDWISTRDESSLNDIFVKELGIDLSMTAHYD